MATTKETLDLTKTDTSYERRLMFCPGGTGQNGYKQALYLSKYPTQNCQVSAIGLAYNMLRFQDSPEFILKLMTTIKKNTCRQILIDIKTEKYDEFKKVMRPYAKKVFKRRYISTNGSDMTMSLLVWKKF